MSHVQWLYKPTSYFPSTPILERSRTSRTRGSDRRLLRSEPAGIFITQLSTSFTPLGRREQAEIKSREVLQRMRQPTVTWRKRTVNSHLGSHWHHQVETPGGSYNWHRMHIMKDHYQLLWGRNGNVKTSFTKK